MGGTGVGEGELNIGSNCIIGIVFGCCVEAIKYYTQEVLKSNI